VGAGGAAVNVRFMLALFSLTLLTALCWEAADHRHDRAEADKLISSMNARVQKLQFQLDVCTAQQTNRVIQVRM
jgi:hypothetical protein